MLPLGISAATLLVALTVDRWLGEPPVRLHPVVWIGRYLTWAGLRVHGGAGSVRNPAENYKAFWAGALAWCAGAAIVFVVFLALQHTVMALAGELGSLWGSLLAALLLGLLLKPLLAWAMLQSEVLAVEKALAPGQGGSLQAGRERLRWLVSRDVTALSEAQVRESAIETLAENLNDSVVAPLFWFALLGLPGAALYRFANTADAMWGYRGVYQGQNWEWAGKWAACADDVLSWMPARLTALLLALAAGGVSLRQLGVEAGRTPSPNSGWPMAAMALALDVSLRKPGVYTLNAPGRAPQAQDLHDAVFMASKCLLALIFCAQAALIYVALRGAVA